MASVTRIAMVAAPSPRTPLTADEPPFELQSFGLGLDIDPGFGYIMSEAGRYDPLFLAEGVIPGGFFLVEIKGTDALLFRLDCRDKECVDPVHGG